MASNLAPKELKDKDRRNTLKTILKNGGVLYVNGRERKITPNKKNAPLIEALENNDFGSTLKVYFSAADSLGTPLSKIDKDSRFVTINLGHTFEIVFAAAAIAAIKLRPRNLQQKTDGKNRIMPDVEEKHIKDVLEKIVNSDKSTITYKVLGYSFNSTPHHDILKLTCEKNTLAFKGAKKLIEDETEYNSKKNKLITPALAYMNSNEMKKIRKTLCFNGVVDKYHVTVMGAEQTKPDVKISVERGNKVVEKEGRLISLKLNSRTFGTVNGGTYDILKTLFENFSIEITKDVEDNVKAAYEQAANKFNSKDIDTQISSIQEALKNFYSGAGSKRVGGTEVLKFSTKTKTPGVYKRLYEEFAQKYKDIFANQKMKASVEVKDEKTPLYLKFHLPNETSSFLHIRCRLVEGTLRHEIEEGEKGMHQLIGTSPVNS